MTDAEGAQAQPGTEADAQADAQRKPTPEPQHTPEHALPDDGHADAQHQRRMRVVMALALVYLFATVLVRVLPSLRPWSAETDWKQWLWIYHRFSTPGAFPSGQLLTDYAFVVQPPGYLAAAAALSFLAGPVFAATVLYTVSFVLALGSAWWAAASRLHPVVALWAAVVVAHDHAFFKHTIGGYPRSFGPALTLLFLAAWMHRKEQLTLLSLVLMAAVYPSVVVPCGLAYGAWSVLLAGRDGFLRRNAALTVVGVVVIALSQLQSVLAPDWWGHVVSLAEAEQMPALGPEGRTAWVPLLPFHEKVVAALTQPFRGEGLVVYFGIAPWVVAGPWVMLALTIGSVAVLARAARRAGNRWAHAFNALPLEPLLLAGASLLAYVLARALAFKLYLPHRVVQHVLPYAVAVFVVIVLARAGLVLLKNQRRALELLALWGPLGFLLLTGDGVLPRGLRTYEQDAPLYTWVEQNVPIDAQLAGNLKVLDELPFFSKRQAYVNWKMAHPFRKGFYAEIERRILAMYDAFYARDPETILAFAAQEGITHFVVDTSLYAWVESGDGALFEPLRSQVMTMWRARRANGFVFLGLPDEVVSFRHKDTIVVEIAKLRAWRAQNPTVDVRKTVKELKRADEPRRREREEVDD